MKLVTFRDFAESPRVGVIVPEDDVIVDLAQGHELLHGQAPSVFRDMLALIDGGAAALDQVHAVVDRVLGSGVDDAVLDAAKTPLLAPVPEPRQMRDCLVFEKHYTQARRQRYRKLAAASADPEAAYKAFEQGGHLAVPPVWYEQPIYYKQNRFSVVGPEADVIWPRYSQVMDFELEFGIIIGRVGKDIPRDGAVEHIFGYTIFNDFSARDAQTREMAGQLGPAKGKDFDSGNVLGPWLVTRDEVQDPYDLTMIARVNGKEWTRGNTGDMHHKFEDIIAHISADETLYPGEFIGSGTVGGGCGLELDRFLSDGDIVELEVSGLGTLRNRVKVQRTVRSSSPATAEGGR